MYPILLTVWKCSSVYIFWITIHYSTAHLYPYFCADISWQGFATSPFLLMAPHCKALSWLQKTSTMAIENMWIVFGTWLCSTILPDPSILGHK